MGPSPAGASPLAVMRTDGICPVLFHFGGDDANPGPRDRALYGAKLAAQGVVHALHAYAGVGHGFSCMDSLAFDGAASIAAWPRTVAWFDEHLALAGVAPPARRALPPPVLTSPVSAAAPGRLCTQGCAALASKL
jgi:acetyl esterase/lipase